MPLQTKPCQCQRAATGWMQYLESVGSSSLQKPSATCETARNHDKHETVAVLNSLAKSKSAQIIMIRMHQQCRCLHQNSRRTPFQQVSELLLHATKQPILSFARHPKGIDFEFRDEWSNRHAFEFPMTPGSRTYSETSMNTHPPPAQTGAPRPQTQNPPLPNPSPKW